MLASADNVIDFNLSLEDWDGQKKAYPEEPMLIENSKRFVLFPIKHHDIWTLYKTAEAKFWSAEEIEFSDDVAHFSDLSGKEQSTMMQILIILATNDALIGPSVVAKISHDIQSPEARCFYGFQIMQRNIHAEVLMMSLGMFVKEGVDQTDFLEAISDLSGVGRKLGWVERYLVQSNDHFAMRIISLAIYNVLFQNSLYDILLHGLKDSILPGLMHAIAKMRQDHKAYFESCLIVRKMMVYVPPASEVHSMVNAAMAVQYLLIDDIVELSGGSLQFVSKINPGDLKKRAQSVADEALRKLDYPVLFGNSDPLVWITAAADKEAARFDHHDGAPVQKAISHAKPMDSDVAFSIDEDF